MDNDTILINDNDLESAKLVCSSILDTQVRNRAVANVVAAEVASRFFDKEVYDIDIETGLHNISKILEQVDISDIYVNGSYVDVRVYFNDDEISIPKSHYDMGISPVVYMFIKLSQDLSKGVITGFIRPESVDKSNINDEYYYISKDAIVSFYDIESRLEHVLDMYEGTNEKLYEFLDGSINNNDKMQLIKDLIKSKNARMVLLKLVKAQSVFNFVSVSQGKNTVSDGVGINLGENGETSDGITEEELDDLFIAEKDDEEENIYSELEYSTEVTPSGADIIAESDILDDELLQNVGIEASETNEISDENPEEQIDNLFTGEQEGIPASQKKKTSGLFMAVLICILVLSGAFVWYTNSSSTQKKQDSLSSVTLPNIEKDVNSENKLNMPEKDAMPNETVNTVVDSATSSEQGNSVEIPAIEQHLDASVLVSNLKVDWEVPAGYVSNTSAKRYLVKLGKVIQLNLKTELLLLSKPPIANKISVELSYNQNSGKFDIVGIVESSGEKTVDEVILRTIKNALSMSISSNIESFGKLQGNPVLIIHL